MNQNDWLKFLGEFWVATFITIFLLLGILITLITLVVHLW